MAALTGFLLVASAVVVPPASVAAITPMSPCSTEARGESVAVTMAARCGTKVEVLDQRTETAQIFANPAGFLTAEESLRPRWVRASDGSWTGADPTLRRDSDGTVRPKGSVFPIVFSGGGAGPLATMAKQGHTMALRWPAALPAPAIRGNVATYPEVMPGVDLEVVADVDGFQHAFVVKDRQAAKSPALRSIDLQLTSDKLSFEVDDSGSVTAKDADGALWFVSAAAAMWDSRGRAAGDALPRSAMVRTRIDKGRLTLEPDQRLLDDPDAEFPIRIDPSWSGGIQDNAFTMVWSRSDTRNSSFWQRTDALLNGGVKGNVGAGRVCDFFSGNTCTSEQYIIRTMIRMNISGAFGRHVLGARFTIEQRHAWACSGTNFIKLWITGGISPSNTWNNQPGWDGNFTAETLGNRKDGGGSGCVGPGNIEFGVTHMINHALASGWPDLTLGLMPNESSTSFWKRFNVGTASLAIDYNSFPTAGSRSTSPSTSCVAGSDTAPAANPPLINDSTPDLRVVTNDPDTETDLRGAFEWQKWSGSVWGSTSSATDSIGRANGGTSQVTPTLTTGTYRWRVRVADPWTYGSSSDTDYSAFTAWCEFNLDATPPPLPTITALDGVYPDGCAPCGGVGTTERFRLSAGASDVTAFFWGFTNPPTTQVNTTSGAAQTIVWTPANGGPRTLFVQTLDAAGNRSAIRTDYDFTVDGADPMVAHWRLDEQLDDFGQVPPLADATGNGHTATMTGGGTVGADARIPGLTATSFNGVDGQAATAGPVLTDTSRSFSVSAWVKRDVMSDGVHTIVSQYGTNNAAFRLEYFQSPSNSVWKFTVSTSDNPTALYFSAEWANGVPKVGSWTHLVGVYDAATRTQRLYVNGTHVSAIAGLAVWDANGPLRIGSGFAGTIADVKVWQRVLFDGEIKDMVQSTAENKAGEYHFGEVDSSFALDSSNYGHTLNLSGGATIPASGAGYDGTGLLLLDGTGDATGDSPSLFTSQSYTVSAWVRLDGESLPDHNVTAVGHTSSWVSPFYLGYTWTGGESRWRFALAGSDEPGAGSGGGSALSAPITAAVLGTWVHLRGTIDATTGAVRLYVNGALAGFGTRTAPQWDASGGLTVGAAIYTHVGGTPVMTDRWVGAIDEVRVYAGVAPVTAGDWRFDSCTGAPVVCGDGATPARPVTLSGDAAWVSDGWGEGPGLTVGGTGFASTAGPAVDTSKSFTVSAWVRPTQTPQNMCVVCFDGTRVDSFFLGYHGSGTWAFWGHAADVDDTSETIALSTIQPVIGEWTHLTAVYDVVNSRIQLYVNGELAATATYTKGWQANGPLVIGREKWNGNALNFWRGSIDDVRVYQSVVADPTFLMH